MGALRTIYIVSLPFILATFVMVVYLMATRKKCERFATYDVLTSSETKDPPNLSTIDLRSTLDSAVNDSDGPLLTYTARPGMIVMWHSPDAPAGWQLCNGQGTLNDKVTKIPNLLGSFPYGAPDPTAGNAYGATGGNSEVTLTVEQIPSHTHTTPFQGWNHGKDGESASGYYWSNGNNKQDAPGTLISSATGGGKPVNIMPPYTQVFFIIKL